MYTSPAGSLHYKSTFKLIADPESGFGWPDIVKQLRSWSSYRNPDEKFGDRWFFTGTEIRPANFPGVFVKTLQASGDGTEDRPQFWSIRYEQPDSSVPFRRWRTDLGVTCLGTHEYQISLMTSHWLLPGFIGEEPPSPLPTAPYIVRMLIASPKVQAFAGSELLSADAIPIADRGGADFVARLIDPNRQCPIILVTRENDTASLKVDPRELSKLLVGTAKVFFSETTGLNEELEWVLPHKYACRNGMVRVYQPRLNFDSERDFRRHRFFTPEQIDEISPSGVVEVLVRGIARGTQMLDRSGVTSIEDVFGKRNEQRLKELRAKYADQPELSEWMAEFDAENIRLNSEIESLEGQKESLLQEVEQLEGDKETLEREKVALTYEAEATRSEANSLREANRSLSTQANAVQALGQLPSSILEAVELVARLHPDKIVFTERAKVAAKRASFKDIHTAWKCLWSMATILHALYFDPEEAAANIPVAFAGLTEFELALTESSETQKDKALMKLRQLDYNGQELDITPHVKYGTKPPKCFRVYFHAHQLERRIVVGHCGDHLPTSGTRRL